MLWIEWFRCVMMLRTSCSRYSTFIKLVLVLAGFCIRPDLLGVTSIVRTGFFAPDKYRNLLHFFHSRGLNLTSLSRLWVDLAMKLFSPVNEDGYLVFIADGLKAPKEGKKMPGVKSLHQESANNSKPSFIMGHSFQVISMLVEACGQHLAIPLLSRISEGVLFPGEKRFSLLEKLVSWFLELTGMLGNPAILVADAYYAGRTLILPLLSGGHHLVTRLKTNCVAFHPPVIQNKKRGRPKSYGDKVKLYDLFKDLSGFTEAPSPVYSEHGVVIRYLSVALLWRPVGRMVRFVLISHPSRGNITLMCTNLELDPLKIIKLYGLRFKIEVSFKQAVHTLGTYYYHFWMSDLLPRRRGSGDLILADKTDRFIENVQRKMDAYHRYVMLGCIAQGLLQHLAINHKKTVWSSFRSWLRTMRTDQVPSEFVVSLALKSSLPDFLLSENHDSGLKKIIFDNANHDILAPSSMAA